MPDGSWRSRLSIALRISCRIPREWVAAWWRSDWRGRHGADRVVDLRDRDRHDEVEEEPDRREEAEVVDHDADAARHAARRLSHSTLGRIAEAITKPRKSSAMTIRIFQSASATMTIAMTTSVAIAVVRAVSPIPRDSLRNQNEGPVAFEAHRHGIALARPLLRSLLLAAAGVACFLAPWPRLAFAGAALLALAAFLVVVAVARWDRTHLA